MNRLSRMSLNAALSLILLPLVWVGQPAHAQASQPQPVPLKVAPAREQKQIDLNLTIAKQVEEINAQGQPQKVWKEMSGDRVQVVPGDVLRYSLTAMNKSERPSLNLVVTQPIPTQTVYVLRSANGEEMDGISISYSIDKGSSFVPNPMIEVKQGDGKLVKEPAPAELYTHVRWTFEKPITPQTTEKVSYQVQVK